ncbi:hypothetical protein M3Y99_00912400 [Aphelenchoides fujianensis]|nr:hypothetical protein M3Y99_00912400 [Aphelenchoides fujianensis]
MCVEVLRPPRAAEGERTRLKCRSFEYAHERTGRPIRLPKAVRLAAREFEGTNARGRLIVEPSIP